MLYYLCWATPTQGKVMTLDEMEDLFKQEGVTIHRRKRRKQIYLYAARRSGLKVKEVYVAPLSKAKSMTPEQFKELLLRKIASLKSA